MTPAVTTSVEASPALVPWLQFLACVLAIGIAGPILTRSAEQIAQRGRLSRSVVGLFLLSTATSLPELATGLSGSAVASAPNLAVGDALGSCVFNLALVALLDLFSREDCIFRRVHQGHILTAALGIVMIGFVGAQILIGRDALDIRVLHVSVYSPALVLLYFICLGAVLARERAENTPAAAVGATSSANAVRNYLLSAFLILAAGSWLPFAGLQIADAMGWRTSFVGTILLAATTSLPELVVVLAALRLGAVDLAIASLLGSNLFDVFIIGLDDFAYTDGALLAHVSPVHAGTAFAAVMMSGLVIIGILNRPSYRIFGVAGWISLSLIVLYLASSYAIFLMGL
jgi:cation:H+ antiporter